MSNLILANDLTQEQKSQAIRDIMANEKIQAQLDQER